MRTGSPPSLRANLAPSARGDRQHCKYLLPRVRFNSSGGEQSVEARCALVQAKQRVSTSRRSRLAVSAGLLPHTERDLPLPETPKGTILTRNDPESGSVG